MCVAMYCGVCLAQYGRVCARARVCDLCDVHGAHCEAIV